MTSLDNMRFDYAECTIVEDCWLQMFILLIEEYVHFHFVPGFVAGHVDGVFHVVLPVQPPYGHFLDLLLLVKNAHRSQWVGLTSECFHPFDGVFAHNFQSEDDVGGEEPGQLPEVSLHGVVGVQRGDHFLVESEHQHAV